LVEIAQKPISIDKFYYWTGWASNLALLDWLGIQLGIID
jgi:hypothetical protein